MRGAWAIQTQACGCWTRVSSDDGYVWQRGYCETHQAEQDQKTDHELWTDSLDHKGRNVWPGATK